MGYKRDAFKGLSWLGGLRIATRIVSFGRTVLLARILSPLEFGLFGIASLVLIFIETLTETGINIFLVQEERQINSYINTAWVVSILRGILIALCILIFTPFIATFFNSPNATHLLLLISLVPFIRGFINPSIANFQKNLEFNKEFQYRLIIFIVDSTIAVIAALILQSAISIVYGLLAGAVIEVFLSFIMAKPFPNFSFEKEKLRHVVNRGKWVTSAGIFSYLFHNGDDILVGRLLNTSSLGIYQVGYKISSLPITEFADVISKVVFPIYVKIGGDKDRLKKAFLQTLLITSLLVIPLGIAIYLFAEPLIFILLGEKWKEVVPIVQILAVFGILRAITGISAALFFAVKKQEYNTIITLISLIVLGIFIFPAIRYFGVLGAAYAVVTATVISLPFSIYFTFKILQQKYDVQNEFDLIESKPNNE